MGAPPPPLPHLPSLHHPKIWIFFFRIPFFFFFFLKNPKTRKPGFENPETRPNLTPDIVEGVLSYKKTSRFFLFFVFEKVAFLCFTKVNIKKEKLQ